MVSLPVLYAAVLFSAFTHAAWNAMVKKSGDRLLMLAAIRSVGLVAGIIAAIMVPLPSAESIPYLTAAALAHYIYYAMMLNAYRLGDISQVYPISRGTAPLVVVLLGFLFAGELLSGWTVLAICIVSSGILILSVSGSRISRPALLFALATGLAISGYSFLSGLGVRESASMLAYIAWLEIAKGGGMVLFAGIRRRYKAVTYIKENWRSSVVAGFLSVFSWTVSVAVMSVAPIAPVVALRVTSVVFAAIMGTLLLKEGYATRRITAAAIVMAGVMLLGWASS